MTNSNRDEKLSYIVDEFGMEGYGAFWIILEIIAEQMDTKTKHFCEFSVKKWRKSVGFSPKKFQNFVVFCKKIEIFLVEFRGERVFISCPNLLKYRDEYSKKKEREFDETPEKLRTDSAPSRARVTDTDTDTDTDIKKNIKKKLSNTNLKKSAEKLLGFYNKKIQPEQISSTRAKKNIETHLKSHFYDSLLNSIENYSIAIKKRNTQPEYRKDPANFFGMRDMFFLDYLDTAVSSRNTTDIEKEKKRIEEAAQNEANFAHYLRTGNKLNV